MSRSTEVGNQLLFLIERRRLDEAAVLLGEALLDEPESFILGYFGALLDFERGKFDQANDAAARLLLRKPEDEATRYLLFRIALEREDAAQSLERISDLCRDYPGNANYAASRAAQLLYFEQVDKAIDEAERALRLNPQSKAAQEILAYSKLAGAQGGMDPQLLQRLRSDPSADSTRQLLLTSLVRKGDYRDALDIARTLLRHNPKDEDLLEVVKELRVLAHPSQRMFQPFHWLDSKGFKRAYVISGLMVGVLKGVAEGVLPVAGSLPIVIYLAAAGIWSWLLRRWLD